MIVTLEPKKNRRSPVNASTHSKRAPAFELLMRANRVELTDGIKKAICRKIDHARQFAPEAFRARIHLERHVIKGSPHSYRVVVRYELPGYDILAEHHAGDALGTFQTAMEKVERRLRTRKTTALARRMGAGRKRAAIDSSVEIPHF
jgi:ribosomal subunit interface protein